MFIKDESSQYGEGVLVDEYQGVYSLVAAQESKDGKIYTKWCHPQGAKNTIISKAIPWKIKLGTKQDAVSTLKAILAEIAPENEDIDAPF